MKKTSEYVALFRRARRTSVTALLSGKRVTVTVPAARSRSALREQSRIRDGFAAVQSADANA